MPTPLRLAARRRSARRQHGEGPDPLLPLLVVFAVAALAILLLLLATPAG